MDRAPFTCRRDGDVFVIAGALDEKAQLQPLLRWSSSKRVILDLAGVTFVNSLGVREWVRLQAAARDAGVRLELRRVAEPLVLQLNVVPAARIASDVTSFYATYICDACGEEQPELIEVASLADMKPPVRACRACGKPAMLAAPPDLYFSFLSGTSPLR
jgi:anti-anti-sigma regulatory factor